MRRRDGLLERKELDFFMKETALRIIIADNNVQDRESKERSMREMGMEVVLSTGNGSKALEAIREKRPDVVVMGGGSFG